MLACRLDVPFVLLAEPIVIADGPNEFTRDWAFIQFYNKKIDWARWIRVIRESCI